MAVSYRLMHQRAGENVSARGREPAPPGPTPRVACSLVRSFDVWGDVAAGGVDVAEVLAVAAVHRGGFAWVGTPSGGGAGLGGGRRPKRVRMSGWPVYGPGQRVDAVFVLGRGPAARAVPSPEVIAAQVGGRTPVFVDGADRGTNAVHPLPLSALAARIPWVERGSRFVLLGMWTWMWSQDPDGVRRTLESALGHRHVRLISGALRLFEQGWREAPQWAPRWSWSSGADAASPGADGDRTAVMDGARALAAGVRAGGLSACRLDGGHPSLERVGRAFLTLGGRVVDPDGRIVGRPAAARGREKLDARPGGATDGARALGPGCVGEVQCVVRAGRSIGSMGGTPRVVICLHRLEPRGDGRPVVLAPTTVAECYAFAALAVTLASQHRRDVHVLVDAALVGAVEKIVVGLDVVRRAGEQLFGREGVVWSCGAPARLAHDLTDSTIVSAPLEAFVRPAAVVGGDEGDVLLLGWGATRTAVEEAAARMRAQGRRVSSLHLRTLNPLPPNLPETLARFRRVVVVDEASDADAVSLWPRFVPWFSVSPRVRRERLVSLDFAQELSRKSGAAATSA